MDHDGEARSRTGEKTNPRLEKPPVSSPAPHPRGAAIRRHVVWRGGCGACGRGLRLAPGRLREPPWGYYGPCARSSLGGGWSKPAATPQARLARKGNWRERPAAGRPASRKRGPETQERRHGGAPRGVREVAQSSRAASWLNGSGYQTRLAALRCPSMDKRPQARPAGDDDLCVILGRSPRVRPSVGPRINSAQTRESQDQNAPIKASSGLRCSGQARA